MRKNTITVLFLMGFCWGVSVPLTEAATYFVRPDGGNATQCTGLNDAAYPGSGTAQACALNHPFWVLAPKGNNPSKMRGGDTLIIDGSNKAQYMMGWGAPNINDTSICYSAWPWDCTMRPIPSGPDPAHPTRILGKGWDTGCANPPQLWGKEKAWHILTLAGSNNVEVQCLEITDHDQCQYLGPNGCNNSNAPFGNYAVMGIFAQDSNNVLLKNLNIHGLHTGIKAGRIKDWTVDNTKIVGNSFVGWNGDLGGGVSSSNSGTITFNKSVIAYSGCGETYPGNQPYNCYSQDQGGYGDGFGTEKTGGNWIFNNVDFSHNVSDGLDLLYHDGNGSITIKRSRFEGNAGNQVKTAGSAVIENSLLVGNCGYFKDKAFTYSVGGFNHCRAAGSTLAALFFTGSKVSLMNSTLTGNGDSLIISSGSTCNGTESFTSRNNIILGGTEFNDGADLSSLYYATGAMGNGDGPCGAVQFVDAGSVYWNIKNQVNVCAQRPGSKCADPKFIGPVVKYFSGDAYNLALNADSPARSFAQELTGMSTLDYNNFDRGSDWDSGALEYGSVSTVAAASICGNKLVEYPEQCDDGNLVNGDGCNASCIIESPSVPVCGNKVKEGSEQCDDGNLTNGDGCNNVCQIEVASPVCGNGKLESSEQCDDGNVLNNDGCSSVCQVEILSVCGNAKLESGEQCDDGNKVSGDGCSSSCVRELPICGNAKLEGSEQCDDGNLISGDGCSSSCVKELPVCGNAKLESGEQCDDGNNTNNDGCSSSCLKESLPVCGNGIKEGTEVCDDGNLVSNDGCNSICKAEWCGNGIKEGPEQCDDGNWINRDGCSALCILESVKPVCGNGKKEGTEACDDGNLVSNDGCSSSCSIEQTPIPVCGNEKIESPETCDDGNRTSGDGCSSSCQKEVVTTRPVCGNGKLEGSEQCDDGNRVSGDGCNRYCKKERIRTR